MGQPAITIMEDRNVKPYDSHHWMLRFIVVVCIAVLPNALHAQPEMGNTPTGHEQFGYTPNRTAPEVYDQAVPAEGFVAHQPGPILDWGPGWDQSTNPGCAACSGRDISVSLGSGPWIPIGGGTIESHLDTGWALQFGVREKTPCGGSNFFFITDFGIDYVRLNSDDVPEFAPGLFEHPEDTSHDHPLENFLRISLQDISRVGFSFAVGGGYYPVHWNAPGARNVALTCRAGLRAGPIWADYDQGFSPELQELIDVHIGIGLDPDQFIFTSGPGGEDPEFFFGLFGSIGIDVLYNDVRVWNWCFRNVTFRAALELGHDWFDLGDFGSNDYGLGFVTPVVSVSTSY